MALTIRLETTGPGQGLFRIAGIEAPGGTLELAIQRNLDDKYLGNGQLWQITPHWHWLPGVESNGKELSVRAGPEIVDPVAAASNMALRVLVRAHGKEDASVLRITGHLFSSPAALALDESELPPAPPPEPELALDLELNPKPREPVPDPAESGRSRGPLVGLSVLALAIVTGVGAWQLGWLDPWLVPDNDLPTTMVESPPDQAATEVEPIPETARSKASDIAPAKPVQDPSELQPPTDEPAATPLRGVAFARVFLSENPKPRVIQAEAERQEQAADCDAAMVLYNQAAKSDPDLAVALAERVDPRDFNRQGCIEVPDILAASNWYQTAADAGNPAAQRRLGQLLVAQEASGPMYEDGIRWLRRAAQAGDQEAKDTLAKMGKR